MTLSKLLPNEIIVETISQLNDRDLENLVKSDKQINEIYNKNKEYINKIRYDTSNIKKNFENASCSLQKQAILTIYPNKKNKNTFSEYKFNEKICVCCGKIINYCKVYFKLTFYYHYKVRYCKLFKIDVCSKKCSNKFVYSNDGDNYPSENNRLKHIERYYKNTIYCIKTKYLHSGHNGFVKIKDFKYKYNDYKISFHKIENEALKYLKNQL